MQLNNSVHCGLELYGLQDIGTAHWNLATPVLYEEMVRRREGFLSHLGPIVVRTGNHVGLSPEDKFIVLDPTSEEDIWWGKSNKPLESANFDVLYSRLVTYFKGRDVFVQDCCAGSDIQHEMPIRVITEDAWHSLFARNVFVRLTSESALKSFVPRFTLIHAPGFHAIPEVDGTRSGSFIIIHLAKKLILIGGTAYAGEIKKAIFALMTYLLPHSEVLPLHASANMSPEGDTALFCGVSGSGKTALSIDRGRSFIGDDQHGWGEEGVFNLEGGCYANIMSLSNRDAPQIFECTRKFGTILENVYVGAGTRRIDLSNASLSDSTRAAYPLSHIENAVASGFGDHPRNIFMLVRDAFGVFPPIARLTPDQAVYQFLSGYSTQIEGAEFGVAPAPQAVFSSCFDAPFIMLHPMVYGKMLEYRIKRYGVKCWLINTGWFGGPCGTGERIDLARTRALIGAALRGQLDGVPTQQDPVFGFQIPLSCEGVGSEILNPRSSWPDSDAYDQTLHRVAGEFKRNFTRFGKKVPQMIREAGPMTDKPKATPGESSGCHVAGEGESSCTSPATLEGMVWGHSPVAHWPVSDPCLADDISLGYNVHC